jgi:hypothetical protein
MADSATIFPRITMGAWASLLRQLAEKLPAGSSDPAVRAARALIQSDNKPTPLMKALQEKVIPERNEFAHSVIPYEEVFAPQEAPLHRVGSGIISRSARS